MSQLTETEARDALMTMMKTGHWTASESDNGKKIILRFRKEPVLVPSDLLTIAEQLEAEKNNNKHH